MSNLVVQICTWNGPEQVLRGYALYQGSASLVHPTVFKTRGELVAAGLMHWRTCTCAERDVVDAIACHEDDRNIWWSGTLCLKCFTFMQPSEPDPW